MFSTLPQTNINFLDTSILLSANAFDLDRTKILQFGKVLICTSVVNAPILACFAGDQHFLLFQQFFLAYERNIFCVD